MSESKRTLIEEGTELKGTLTSSCPIVVHGPGREADDRPVGRGHRDRRALSGKAKVNELRSRGELAGEFDADIVELSGRVRDKTIIRAKTLEVRLQREEGRVEMVFGDCELAVGDAPDKAKAIAGAMNGHGKKKKPDEQPIVATADPPPPSDA